MFSYTHIYASVIGEVADLKALQTRLVQKDPSLNPNALINSCVTLGNSFRSSVLDS